MVTIEWARDKADRGVGVVYVDSVPIQADCTMDEEGCTHIHLNDSSSMRLFLSQRVSDLPHNPYHLFFLSGQGLFGWYAHGRFEITVRNSGIVVRLVRDSSLLENWG
jgi:hypothetical protein